LTGGHGFKSVTPDYVYIDEALKLALDRTSSEIQRLLAPGFPRLNKLQI
jgi:hypothetical protein